MCTKIGYYNGKRRSNVVSLAVGDKVAHVTYLIRRFSLHAVVAMGILSTMCVFIILMVLIACSSHGTIGLWF